MAHHGSIGSEDDEQLRPNVDSEFRVKSQLKPCFSWRYQGCCLRGNECPYFHEDPPGSKMNEPISTRPCFSWRDQGKCAHGDACKFIHGDRSETSKLEPPRNRDIRVSFDGYFDEDSVSNDGTEELEMKPCFTWQKRGNCSLGDSCRYYHGGLPLKNSQKCPRPANESTKSSAQYQVSGKLLLPGKLKTKPCFSWQNQGNCAHGDACKFIHGVVTGSKKPGPPRNVASSHEYEGLFNEDSESEGSVLSQGLKPCFARQKQGGCSLGDACRYSHGEGKRLARDFGIGNKASAQVEVRGSDKFKTKPCFSWQDQGNCAHGDACKFIHGVVPGSKKPGPPRNVASSHEYEGLFNEDSESEGSVLSQGLKPCFAWQKCGSCSRGDSCPYGHRESTGIMQQKKSVQPVKAELTSENIREIASYKIHFDDTATLFRLYKSLLNLSIFSSKKIGYLFRFVEISVNGEDLVGMVLKRNDLNEAQPVFLPFVEKLRDYSKLISRVISAETAGTKNTLPILLSANLKSLSFPSSTARPFESLPLPQNLIDMDIAFREGFLRASAGRDFAPNLHPQVVKGAKRGKVVDKSISRQAYATHHAREASMATIDNGYGYEHYRMTEPANTPRPEPAPVPAVPADDEASLRLAMKMLLAEDQAAGDEASPVRGY